MKKTITSIILFIILVIAGTIGKKVYLEFLSPKMKISYNTILMKAASEINKNCPIMVDSETRLDNASGGTKNEITYNYTFVNHNKSELDIIELKNSLRPNIVEGVKTNPDLKGFRENKVIMKYRYKDKEGSYLFDIVITPQDYENY